MGDPSTDQVMGFGTLIANPSSGDAPYYGGTALGAIGAALLRPRTRHRPRRSPSRGLQATDSIFLSQDVDLFVVFQSYEAAALSASFYDTTDTLVKLPGSKAAGSWLSDESVALLLAPDDSNAPGFYLPRTAPLHDRLDIPFGAYFPVSLAMRFWGLPPASGDSAQIGLLSDLLTGWTS